MYDAVIAEFGDPNVDEGVETAASPEEVDTTAPDLPEGTIEGDITLVTFQSRQQGAEA